MDKLRLGAAGAWCAISLVVAFVAGVVLMSTGGVSTLIPETGAAGTRTWLEDVNGAGPLFFAGVWLIIEMGLFGLVAFVGFYDRLRVAGNVMILAPILGAVGMTLVTVSHLIPIAMAYGLAPAYTGSGGSGQDALSVTTETLTLTSLLTNYTGNALVFGVVVAVFGGWLGPLGPLSDVVEGVSVIGFLGFFVFMASKGVTLLRRQDPHDRADVRPAPA